MICSIQNVAGNSPVINDPNITGGTASNLSSISVDSVAPLGGAATISGQFTGTGTQSFQQLMEINLTDTGTNMSGIAKINGVTSNLTFGGGASGPGNRNAIWSRLIQNGATTYDSCCIYNTGLFSWADIQQGNTTNPLGYWAMAGLAEIKGTTVATDVKGLEVGSLIGATASAQARYGVSVVSGGGTVVPTHRGTAFDAAYAVGADGGAVTWKNGYVLGDVNGVWPFASDSKLVVSYGGGVADTGIDFSNVTFTSAAISTPNFVVNPDGAVRLGSAALVVSGGELGMAKMTASGVAPGAVGAKLAVVCGTNSGTAKVIAYAGTSATPATVLDNIGSGVSGC